MLAALPADSAGARLPAQEGCDTPGLEARQRLPRQRGLGQGPCSWAYLHICVYVCIHVAARRSTPRAHPPKPLYFFTNNPTNTPQTKQKQQVGDFGLATVRTAASSAAARRRGAAGDSTAGEAGAAAALTPLGEDSSLGGAAGFGGGGAAAGSRSASFRLAELSLEEGGGSESITGGIGVYVYVYVWHALWVWRGGAADLAG